MLGVISGRVGREADGPETAITITKVSCEVKSHFCAGPINRMIWRQLCKHEDLRLVCYTKSDTKKRKGKDAAGYATDRSPKQHPNYDQIGYVLYGIC